MVRQKKLVLFLVFLCLLSCILVPSLYWKLKNNNSKPPCKVCSCDCNFEAKFSIPVDCGGQDRDMKEEMKKDDVTLLSEELSLHKNVSKESLEHTHVLITGAHVLSSRYRYEAEKCNSGMGICEGAREKADSQLVSEHRLTILWEKRARELGWNKTSNGDYCVCS